MHAVDKLYHYLRRNYANATIWFICLIVILAVFSASLYASHEGQYKYVDGIGVYLVVMPAEMLTGHPKGHPESNMHSNQRVEGINQHHFTVSVLNHNNTALMNGLIVEAKVFGVGFNGPRKNLELMIMENSPSFCNFFTVPKQGAYRVELEIYIPEKTKSVKVTFGYASA